jgi:hypothetical protein
MTPVSNVNSAALLILQQAKSVTTASGQNRTNSGDVAAIANGLSSKTGGTGQTAQAQSGISDSTFNLNKLKVDLYERTGQALGVDIKDYASPQAYAAALSNAVGEIKSQNPGTWQTIIAGVEHQLGLDKLGVSLGTVIDSIANPGGDSDKKLDKALAKLAGIDIGGNDSAQASPLSAVQVNEIGLYSPAGV